MGVVMTDEAREAAWDRYVNDGDAPATFRGACDAGFDAGVAEGIRQAREAVALAVEKSADYGPNFYPDDALSAIDNI